MTFKTFFAICGVLITIIIGILSYQIFTQPYNNCVPSVTAECMSNWELLCLFNCGGEHVGDLLLWAYCNGDDCVGTYKYYCDGPDGREEFYGTCANTFHWQCVNY